MMGIQLKNGTVEPGRNELCVCGSGLKYKWCHGDAGKLAVCDRIVHEKMVNLIMKEKHKRGLLSGVEYNAFLAKRDPKTPREPVKGTSVNELIDSAGLVRCVSCGAVVPSGNKLCVKCKKKG